LVAAKRDSDGDVTVRGLKRNDTAFLTRRGRGLSGSHDSSSDFEKDEHTEETGEGIGNEDVYKLRKSVAEVTEDLRLTTDESEDDDGKRWWISTEARPISSELVIPSPDSASHM
jgi:hypothetical protein